MEILSLQVSAEGHGLALFQVPTQHNKLLLKNLIPQNQNEQEHKFINL